MSEREKKRKRKKQEREREREKEREGEKYKALNHEPGNYGPRTPQGRNHKTKQRDTCTREGGEGEGRTGNEGRARVGGKTREGEEGIQAITCETAKQTE